MEDETESAHQMYEELREEILAIVEREMNAYSKTATQKQLEYVQYKLLDEFRFWPVFK